MAQDKKKDYQEFDMTNHKTESLFTEWPTPSDTVRGFGGNPAKAEGKQWNMKKSGH